MMMMQPFVQLLLFAFTFLAATSDNSSQIPGKTVNVSSIIKSNRRFVVLSELSLLWLFYLCLDASGNDLLQYTRLVLVRNTMSSEKTNSITGIASAIAMCYSFLDDSIFNDWTTAMAIVDVLLMLVRAVAANIVPTSQKPYSYSTDVYDAHTVFHSKVLLAGIIAGAMWTTIY